MPFQTRLTDELALKVPLLSAPMAHVSGAGLACAVSAAGGLGLIGGGYCDRDWLTRELSQAAPDTVAIGFITWALEQTPDLLNLAIDHRPRAILLSFGNLEPFVKPAHDAGVSVIAQVQTVEGAQRALDCGADILVAQGSEAGGHSGARSTMALVPAIRDVAGDRCVIAAGGIADGRGLAAALMLGADGVMCGTAFCAAEEAYGHDRMKQAVLAARGDETLRSNVFDAARGLSWPAPYTLRARNNAFHEIWRDRPEAISGEERERYARAARNGNPEIAAVIVGEAVDLVDRIAPAADIIDRIMTGAGEAFARMRDEFRA